MTFRQAQLKLLAYVVDRIHNGELTERGFARLIGISQPHVHNVLKGVRNLSPEIFDSILKYFHLSLLDLAPVEEVEANLKKRKEQIRVAEAPFLDSPIGPGLPWPTGINWRRSYPLPFPALRGEPGLMMAELAPDPYMYETLAGSDIALLDTSERTRSVLSPMAIYVVSRAGESVLRHIRTGGQGFYLMTDATLDNPALWEKLALPTGELAAIIKARVRWVGRERDRRLPLNQRGRFL
ncbi:MAG TPA: helix-turn-helix transcriptional regulator [Bryobacteraceae bacterium]|nr:helix-turn-helix transcriptional regulator [Bryobacteraceae bacterium]